MRFKEIMRQTGKDTATVTAITAVGLGIHETCGYLKDSAVSFFNESTNRPTDSDPKDQIFRQLDFSN